MPNSKKVVVIGGGLAGLTAAYRLHNAGANVQLFEARNRVGGRVFTVKLNGNFVELGGQNFTDGGDASNLCNLIHEFDLKLTKSHINLNHSFFDGNDLIPVNHYLRNRKFNAELLRSQLKTLAATSRNMKEVLMGIAQENDPLYKIAAVRLAAYEGAPVENLSPIYIETLFHMFMGGICSVHQGNWEEENYVELVSIQGGNALLPEKMSNRLGSNLHLNKVLKKVTQSKERSYALTFQDGSEIQTDILVLAIPSSIFKDIIFDDVISRDRLNAIESIQYGTNAKILVPFYKKPNVAGVMDEKIVNFFDAIKNTLTIYLTGDTSFFNKATISEAYAKARVLMERGFKDACPPFEPPQFAGDKSFVEYETPVGYSWPNDMYVKGSYSYIAPGQEALLTSTSKANGELFRTLFAPIEQRFYFAGEHTSILFDIPGTMEAACESGERVARTILN